MLGGIGGERGGESIATHRSRRSSPATQSNTVPVYLPTYLPVLNTYLRIPTYVPMMRFCHETGLARSAETERKRERIYNT